MTHPRIAHGLSARRALVLCLSAAVVAMPFALASCDRNSSSKKTTTTKTTSTPEGVKKTTETTEKKTVTEPKP